MQLKRWGSRLQGEILKRVDNLRSTVTKKDAEIFHQRMNRKSGREPWECYVIIGCM